MYHLCYFWGPNMFVIAVASKIAYVLRFPRTAPEYFSANNDLQKHTKNKQMKTLVGVFFERREDRSRYASRSIC